LSDAADSESVYGTLPGFVVGGGAFIQRRHGGDEIHLHPKFGNFVGAVAVDFDQHLSDGVHHGHVICHVGQACSDSIEFFLEAVPEHGRLGWELIEERTALDAGRECDLLDRRLLVTLLGEEPETEEL